MSIILRKLGRVELARSIHRDILNENDYYHFTIGKTTEWDDEESPESPIDSDSYANQFRRNIMFTQAVSSADICLLTNRVDWASGTVYDAYDDNYNTDNPAYSEATSLDAANFYVITDQYKVYKCIENNGNEPSTIKPTSTSTSVVLLGDNYKWKFLFQVSTSDQTKFLTSDYIPVRKLTGMPLFDVNGEIDSIAVLTGGSAYSTNPHVIITGDGTGATATAARTGSAVSSITVTSAGSGYSFAFATITDGGGTGATATVTLGDDDSAPALQAAVEGTSESGTIDNIILLTPGQDYVGGDVTVVITGDGSGAEATVTIAEGTGVITGITITNNGSEYTFADIAFSNGVGTGTGATARAIISPQGGHGSNPVRELFATTLGITISLSENTNSDLILNNDFRQVGLIKNIYNYDEDEIYTTHSGTASYIIDVDSDSDYAVDDVLTTDSDGEFIVVQIVDPGTGTYKIYLQAVYPLISNASILTNTTQDISNLSINSVVEPEISIKTGEIMYMENRLSTTRSSEQVETIKSLIKF